MGNVVMKLSMAMSVTGALGFLTVMFENIPKKDPRWQQFKSRFDTEIADNYMRRASIWPVNHVMFAWRSEKLALYATFQKWLKDNERLLPPPKPPISCKLPSKKT